MRSKKLIDAIKNNELVFFIGSGFSKPLGLPVWSELISKIISKLDLEEDDRNIFISMANNPRFSGLEVLDKLIDNKSEIYNIISEEISGNHFTPEQLQKHKKLGEISSKIITTNYDRALEFTYPESEAFLYNNNQKLSQMHRYNEYIFKLHGCIQDIERCIIFSDDYIKLYNENSEHKSAIEELKKIISEKTIVFIGYSLNDECIKKLFEFINQIYRGFSNKHFMVTTENVENTDNIEYIKISNWENDLDELLDELIKIKQDESALINTKVASKVETHSEVTLEIPKKIKIATMICDPIDKNLGYNLHEILKPFRNMDVTIDCFNLSFKDLNSLEGYDYLLFFTKSINGKIFVEDNYLLCKSVTLEELVYEVIDEVLLKCVIIFSDSDQMFQNSLIQLPLIIKEYDKDYQNFIFRFFKRSSQLNLSNTFVLNEQKIQLSDVPKGKATFTQNKTKLPPEIDHKELTNFVGRISDLETICRKILDLNGQVLTIKASGGIGKTTIVKKASIELANRGCFSEGIHFIDCEYINNYDTFENKIGQCFNLDRVINFKEHMVQNSSYMEKLIILDNFESLLYINDVSQVKRLVTFVCDYSSVVITSREWNGFEFEQCYELRALTTDECVDLFQKYYKNTISSSAMTILRSDIIERLLNNNPLAIKIVTSNIPKLKSMEMLKIELEEDFFNTTNLNYSDIFNESVDKNIERLKSLYHSINYSYSKLTSNEKLVLELLSLFPDGIHMSNFVKLFNNKEYQMDGIRVTDRQIKLLENKSLIQNSSAHISLQSIIGRFAAAKFNERSELEKKSYYTKAFSYNLISCKFLIESDNLPKAESYKYFDKSVENYLKSLTYMEHVTIDKVELLKYIYYLSISFRYQAKRFTKSLKEIKHIFKDVNNANLFFNVCIYYCEFFQGEFEGSIKKLEKLLPLSDAIELYKSDNIVNHLICFTALNTYWYGNELDILNTCVKDEKLNDVIVVGLLFPTGCYEILEKNKKFIKDSTFFSAEVEFNLGKINIDYINHLIEGTYKNDHVELMQLNYIKAKMGYITKNIIDQLVVVNPYCNGLKKLMYAFLEEDIEEAALLYQAAIKSLEYIKYYYVEAIYYFSLYLFKNKSENYEEWVTKGRDYAVDYQYRFLIYKFDCLINQYSSPYVEGEYSLSVDTERLKELEVNTKEMILT